VLSSVSQSLMQKYAFDGNALKKLAEFEANVKRMDATHKELLESKAVEYVLLKEVLGLKGEEVEDAFLGVWAKTIRDIGGVIGWEDMDRVCAEEDGRVAGGAGGGGGEDDVSRTLANAS